MSPQTIVLGALILFWAVVPVTVAWLVLRWRSQQGDGAAVTQRDLRRETSHVWAAIRRHDDRIAGLDYRVILLERARTSDRQRAKRERDGAAALVPPVFRALTEDERRVLEDGSRVA